MRPVNSIGAHQRLLIAPDSAHSAAALCGLHATRRSNAARPHPMTLSVWPLPGSADESSGETASEYRADQDA
jgi:hypothetical protein